jgi:hypothetical protein
MAIERLRLMCVSEAFYVDLRVTRVAGVWVASADTPDGASLGCDTSRLGAVLAALEPFHGVVPELLENVRHL